jgi:hypothetical protein
LFLVAMRWRNNLEWTKLVHPAAQFEKTCAALAGWNVASGNGLRTVI